MSEEVVIGMGDKGNSSVVIHSNGGEYKFMSHNDVSYWIYLREPFRVEVIVFKDTEQGLKITEMIKKNTIGKIVSEYIFAEMLKVIHPVVLIHQVELAKATSYREGVEAKLRDIKTVLEIEDG